MPTHIDGGRSMPSSATTAHELPLTYNHSFLTLLVRDPFCVFAQWEVAKEDRHARGPNGQHSALVLRMYDVHIESPPDGATKQPLPITGLGQFIDFDVSERGSMYIPLAAPGRMLISAIGFHSSEGTDGVAAGFVPIVVSNIAHMPPGQPAAETAPGRAWGFVLNPGPIFGAHPITGRGPFGGVRGSTSSSDFAWK